MSSPARGDDAVHPLRKGSFLCQGTPGGSPQKLTCLSARGLPSEIRAPFSPTWQVPRLLHCQHYLQPQQLYPYLAFTPLRCLSTETTLPVTPHSGKLSKPGSSSIPSYIMLSIFPTIWIALVNHTFYFKAIIFDPG